MINSHICGAWRLFNILWMWQENRFVRLLLHFFSLVASQKVRIFVRVRDNKVATASVSWEFYGLCHLALLFSGLSGWRLEPPEHTYEPLHSKSGKYIRRRRRRRRKLYAEAVTSLVDRPKKYKTDQLPRTPLNNESFCDESHILDHQTGAKSNYDEEYQRRNKKKAKDHIFQNVFLLCFIGKVP